MNRKIVSLSTLVLLFMVSCHTPDEPVKATLRQSLSSMTAEFSVGQYNTDPDASFSTKVADPNQQEIKIIVPWFYPESSDTPTDITKMRVSANLDNNCVIEPKLGVMDLTKKHSFIVTDGNGAKKSYYVIGEIRKLSNSAVTYFSIREPEITGVIDNVKRTISLITLEDLSAVMADISLSPHATISPDPRVVPLNINTPIELTVTAHDGVTKTVYTVSTSSPEKINYGIREGSETLLWRGAWSEKTGFAQAAGNNNTLAAIGNYLVASVGSGTPVYLNRITGQKIGNINLGGLNVSGGAITNDNNNNLLICDVSGSGMFNIYRTKSPTVAPTTFINWPNSSGLTMGAAISVQGNIDGDAIISVPLYSFWGGATTKFVRWVISAGVVGGAEVVEIGSGIGNGWNGAGNQMDVVYASTKVSDGLFVSYYSQCQLFFVKGNSVQASLSEAPWGGNNNFDCLDVQEFNKARYVVQSCGIHFAWSDTRTYMYDVTNTVTMTGAVGVSPSLVFKDEVGPVYSTAQPSACGDVKLVTSSDGYKLHMYYTDNNRNSLVCYEFDCIKK